MNLKQKAASHVLKYVENGMILGLGSGSTADLFVEMLGAILKSGTLDDILAIPTSGRTAHRAQELGIPLTSLTDHPRIDLAVDGADEVDPKINLIKGLGRALLREKVVEIHAKRLVIIVEESKLVSRLGENGPLPVEIITFEPAAHLHWLNSLGCRAKLWLEDDRSPIITDNGNYLARCWFEGGIPDVYALARELSDRPGIVEHGLFLDMASQVIVAGSGGIYVLER